MKKFYILFLLIVSLILAAKIIHAQTPANPEPLNLTTTPHFFDLSVNPGETVNETIRVRNNNATPTTLKVTVEKLIPDTNGNLVLKDFSAQDEYTNWLTLSSATISAQPREWVDVPFAISIPKTAAFGYYWAILVSTQPGKNQNGATTHIAGAIAIPVLLTAHKEGMTFNARLISFVTDSGLYEYLPTKFLTTIQNKSNVHIRPTGTIFITDSFKNTVAKLSFNKDAGSILPNAKRTYETTWNDSFITYDSKMEDGKIVVDAKGKVEMQTNFHFDKVLSLRMGKYTAITLMVVSGEKNDISFQQATTFFVFPWKIILCLLIIVVLAGVGLWNTLVPLIKSVRAFFKKE